MSIRLMLFVCGALLGGALHAVFAPGAATAAHGGAQTAVSAPFGPTDPRCAPHPLKMPCLVK
jgi:hypothetical protein